jgi:hypothetical protein
MAYASSKMSLNIQKEMVENIFINKKDIFNIDIV